MQQTMYGVCDHSFDFFKGCGDTCEKLLKCGKHHCNERCHAGPCTTCRQTAERKCRFHNSITSVQWLTNVMMMIYQGIHPADILFCPRCARHRKKVLCSDASEFHCQDKCQKMKDCQRHQCKRKCCDGSCPACDNVCGRTLACGKHKCVSRCHVGRCYPCSGVDGKDLSVQLTYTFFKNKAVYTTTEGMIL